MVVIERPFLYPVLGCSGGESQQTHPEIDAHGGDEAAGQKGSVFETDQQAGLPHARVPHQHHLWGREDGAQPLLQGAKY